MVQRSADFGVVVKGGLRVDMMRLKSRKDGVVAVSSESVERSLISNVNCTVYRGHARLISAIPELAGLEQVNYFTHGSILDLESLPPHLVIIGVGYVGLESLRCTGASAVS